ncbi:serine/threonine-protein kinase RsbT [Fictibacillus macauensis ZFHKF-1]|uniref:Serine/threonine-protein kinase RsbT n=1 Tax=Fictibacillus macauensis ZFHKF-1 TaxID=1196324 RepID=I8AMT0_9BACL|nr:hypothetical protein [Fictibacillus macauensis]EIT86994.1 serine/threonine-protein kinase RsbT [Fictibacillus macauensis ZFHKF-1]
MHTHHVIIEIKTEQDISIARHEGKAIAEKMGFHLFDQVRLKTVISELARNIYVYGTEGHIIIEAIQQHNRVGIRVFAIDHGVVNDARQQGLGCLLPGVHRLVDSMNMVTAEEIGTEVVVVKWRKERL